MPPHRHYSTRGAEPSLSHRAIRCRINPYPVRLQKQSERTTRRRSARSSPIDNIKSSRSLQSSERRGLAAILKPALISSVSPPFYPPQFYPSEYHRIIVWRPSFEFLTGLRLVRRSLSKTVCFSSPPKPIPLLGLGHLTANERTESVVDINRKDVIYLSRLSWENLTPIAR